MAVCGTLVVPNCEGIWMMPPPARSLSPMFWALKGAKKSVALRLPSAWTTTRASDSSKLAGGALLAMPPVAGQLGLAPCGLPVAKRMLPAPSDDRPEPDIQMPSPEPAPALVAKRALIAPAVETPMIQPTYGVWSQCDANAP